MRPLLSVLLPTGEPPEEPADGEPNPAGYDHAGLPAAAAPSVAGHRSAAASKHGKELLASHRLPAHSPAPRTWKPFAAGLLLVIVAVGGFAFSGLYLAIPGSPWVTGESGHILGQVKNGNGTPVQGALVSVGPREGRTNSTGHFDVTDVDTGLQVIVVEAPGYRQLRWRTVITGGNPLGYSFVLSPGTGTEKHDETGDLTGGFLSCGALMVIFTLIVLAGAMFCFQRKRYPIATTGAILSFSVGYFQVFFLFGAIIPFGIIFSLASVVLLLFSRGEFT